MKCKKLGFINICAVLCSVREAKWKTLTQIGTLDGNKISTVKNSDTPDLRFKEPSRKGNLHQRDNRYDLNIVFFNHFFIGYCYKGISVYKKNSISAIKCLRLELNSIEKPRNNLQPSQIYHVCQFVCVQILDKREKQTIHQCRISIDQLKPYCSRCLIANI